MRYEFGKELYNLMKKDKSIILLVGDVGYGIFNDIKKEMPERFFNLGICEQSMISIVAGMALQGLKPYCYTITPFLIERAFEQVKIDIDAMKTNVKLVGYADYPTQGITHRELNGEKLMSLFKNIKSYFPKNSEETKQAIKGSYNFRGPTFISLKKNPVLLILRDF